MLWILLKTVWNILDQQGIDIILIDTAGRHKEETSLLEEMNSMYKVAKPESRAVSDRWNNWSTGL